jgi:outer membrane protein TolC
MKRLVLLALLFAIGTRRVSAQTGSVTATQLPVPGTTTSVNTLNPAIQIQGPFAGSASSTDAMPFAGQLSLRDAVQRGLAYNLGVIGLLEDTHQAQGQAAVARSALLPHLSADVTEVRQQINLAASGIRFNTMIPGLDVPALVGPFNVIDIRARLSQHVVDLAAWQTYRSAQATALASDWVAQDARDLVVLAVGGEYLQVVASRARVASARAQVETADALYQQTSQQRAVGVVAQIDVNRSLIESLTQRQRLVSLQNELAKQKIGLARLTGLPPTDQYDIADEVPFSPAPVLGIDEAIARALDRRADLRAATAQLQATERQRAAARSQRLPSISLNADYGAIGTTVDNARGTFAIAGAVHVPLWEGGRAAGEVQRADAALRQRRANLESLRGQVVADVRTAALDVQSGASQVELARANRETARQTLDLTRQRFQAGVTEALDVIRSQEALAGAELDYINSVFAHNFAKLALARAVGGAADNLSRFLVLP